MSSGFFEEFRRNWRALVATSLGLASGMALHPFVLNILAPHMVQALGWSKSEFAMAGAAAALAIISYPLVGRLADRFGVRRIGAIGLAATVLSFVGIASLQGPMRWYIAILILQLTLGAMTTGPVYLRLVVRSFDSGRGLALAIAVSTPAVIAAFASPLLSLFIDAAGWRAGSLAVAAYCLCVGSLALLLIPRGETAASGEPGAVGGVGIRELFAIPAYRVLLATTALISVPLVLTSTQLALVLVDNGMTMAVAGSVAGLFPAGTIAGRMLAGLALDRFPAEFVGVVAFGLPALGMLLLASPLDQAAVLALAVLLMGLAFGAEGDILAYIVSRYFDLHSYGTALGTLFGAVAASALVASPVLSLSLHFGGGYTAFLLLASVSVALGSGLLLRMRQFPAAA